MTAYLSNKLTFFSFWLIVLVIILHSFNLSETRISGFFDFFQLFLGLKITAVAVPLFFSISGYLFFFKINDIKKSKLNFFLDNLKKRINSILIPFLIWCTFWYLIFFLIQHLPVISKFFPVPLSKMPFLTNITYLYIVPVNYPFWFLRDLILLFVFSPLIFIIIKYLHLFALIMFFCFSLFFTNLLIINGANVFLFSSLFYFAVGAYIAIFKSKIFIITTKFTIVILFCLWIALNVISTYYHSVIDENILLFKFINVGKDLVGCVALWNLYDLFNSKKQWVNHKFYSFSFFIFAFHGFPTLIIVLLLKRIFTNHFFLFLFFMLTSVVVIFLCLRLGKIIKKKTPRFYDKITGFR